jgi:Zn-dependent protease
LLAYHAPDAYLVLRQIRYINYGLLIFNLLPIYPLDGGQIVRALLWFPFGQIRSLQISSAVALPAAGLLALVSLWIGLYWMALLAFFLLSRAWQGWQHARALVREVELGHAPAEAGPPT